MTGKDDKVVCRLTVRATHQGEMLWMPATGAAVSWDGNPTYCLADGKILEEWYFEDYRSLLAQPGAFPALASA